MGNANFVLRLLKHNLHTFQASLNHSTRCHVPENINPEYSHLNRNLTILNGNQYEDSSRRVATGLKAEITQKAKKQIDNRVGKLRQNAVYAVEFVISGSHEHLKSMNDEEQEAYFKSGIDYIRKHFGDDNFLSAHIHYDERTPHAHVFFSVVTFDEKKQKHKTHFKHFIDGPTALGKFQDNFHSEVAKRYQMNPNKKKQRTSHIKLAQFYNLIEKHDSDASKNLDYAELEQVVERTFKKKAIEAHTESFDNILNTISKLSEKPTYELNINDFNMFANVLNMTSIHNLMKSSMKTQRKKHDAEQKKQKEQQKYEHERAVYLSEVNRFAQDWINNKDSLVHMVKTNSTPTNDIEIAFAERLSNLEQAYKTYMETKKISKLVQKRMSAYFRTPEMNGYKRNVSTNNDILNNNHALSKLGEVYYSKEPKKRSDIAECIISNSKGFDDFCSTDLTQVHPIDWVTKLIEKIIAILTGIKIPRPSELELIHRPRKENTFDFNRSSFTM